MHVNLPFTQLTQTVGNKLWDPEDIALTLCVNREGGVVCIGKRTLCGRRNIVPKERLFDGNILHSAKNVQNVVYTYMF